MKHARTWEKFVIGFTLCTAALLADLQGSASARQGSEANQGKRVLKIRIEVEGTAVLATLNGSPSARDFVSLLPLTMTLEDYGGIEKIAYLPRKLSTRDAPAGVRPMTGDLAYYAPWGNLAIFHGDFKDSPGLVRLGSIGTGIEALRRPGPLKATISVVED
jgi:hypothetical protein